MVNETVASITVSYNGQELLDRQLGALAKQSTRLDEVIVVDNASTDGTVALVRQKYPKVTLIPLSTNEGVGGGYAAGIQYAIEQKQHGRVWLLDQDSVPLEQSLASLLSAWSNSPVRDRIAAMAPLAINAETGAAYPGFLWKGRQKAIEIEPGATDVQFVDMVISSGMLISGAALTHAGMPRSDFFIDFVDFEHCMRMRSHGYLIGIVPQCQMAHAIGSPKLVSLLGKKHQWITHASWREYYKTRNYVYFVWHQAPGLKAKSFALYRFIKQVSGIILWDPDKLGRVSYMLSGLRDGIRGELGSRVKPS